jgi:streptomycin 6-kinase
VVDPKGLSGERTFDCVNLLRNADAEVALRPGRFPRQVEAITKAASLDRKRLLQ